MKLEHKIDMKIIIKILSKENRYNPPYKYSFLLSLPESEYARYLAKIYEFRTDKKLPLRFCWNIFKISSRSALLSRQQHFGQWVIDKNKCKTFNEKIQWLKLYGVTDLMRKCTDKVKVRDYVKEKIGAEYLKPVLQIVRNEELEVRSNNLIPNSSLITPNSKSSSFDAIDFNKLPNQFVIKCNHGCKWHAIIKDKQKLLSKARLFEKTKNKFTGWLNQEFWCFEGFELQYRNLEHKILIEELTFSAYSEFSQLNFVCFAHKNIYFTRQRIDKLQITHYELKKHILRFFLQRRKKKTAGSIYCSIFFMILFAPKYIVCCVTLTK